MKYQITVWYLSPDSTNKLSPNLWNKTGQFCEAKHYVNSDVWSFTADAQELLVPNKNLISAEIRPIAN